ncbi:MAG: polysaccharide deacetylase family protein [Phycisphaerales bacterium]
MHVRSPVRRGIQIGGSLLATAGCGLVDPLLALAVGGAAAAGMVGVACRPQSDFYLRVLRRGPASRPRVALTFDDGPDPLRTPQVLEVLAREGVPATFFMIGRRALEAPALVREVHGAGHEIGCHSFSHERTLPFRFPARVRREIRGGMEALRRAGAPLTRWYRPPMGFTSPWLAMVAEAEDIRVLNWSVHSHDLASRSANDIVQATSRLRAGDVVLFHDGADRAGAGPACLPGALPRVIESIRARGLEPVTVSELFRHEEAA